MNQNKLPADSSAMILGIIALVIVFLGCCCGILSAVALILSIIGLVSANKSLRLFYENPGVYSNYSRTNVYNAKILNIIGLIISAIITLAYLIYFFIYGAVMSTVIMEAYKQNNADYEWENDSLYYEDDVYEIESDSILLDTIPIIEIQEIDNSEKLKKDE